MPPQIAEIGPSDNLGGHLFEGAIERPHIGIVAASADGRTGLEITRGADFAVAVVEQAHEQFDFSHSIAVDMHLEGAKLGDDLIVDRQPLARQADTGKGAGVLERLGKTCLDDARQPIGPLRAFQVLDDTGRPLDDNALTVQRLQGGWLGDQNLRALAHLLGRPGRSRQLIGVERCRPAARQQRAARQCQRNNGGPSHKLKSLHRKSRPQDYSSRPDRRQINCTPTLSSNARPAMSTSRPSVILPDGALSAGNDALRVPLEIGNRLLDPVDRATAVPHEGFDIAQARP